MRSRVVRSTCWMLLLVFPMAGMAAEANVALLSGNGVVKVNDTAVPRSAAVRAGDRIATGKDSSAVITGRSAVVVLPGDSAVVYGGSKIQLQYGRGVVNAQKGTTIQFANLSISPADPRAKVQLRSDGVMTVSALEGSLNVTDGVYHVVLPAGQMMTRMAAGDEPSPPPPAVHGSKGADWPPPVMHTSKIPGWMIAAGAGAGVAGGLAVTGAFSSSYSSPHRP